MCDINKSKAIDILSLVYMDYLKQLGLNGVLR